MKPNKKILKDLAELASKKKSLEVMDLADEGYLKIRGPHGSASGQLIDQDLAEQYLDKLAPTMKGNEAMYLEDLSVDPNLRGQGHGSEILKKFLEETKKKGIKEVYANASPYGAMNREEALPKLLEFYKKHGAQVLEKDKENAMIKWLLGMGGIGAIASGGNAEAATHALNNPLSTGVGEIGGNALTQLDRITGRPIRAGVNALLQHQNPLQAAKEAVVDDKDVTGSDVAHSLMQANPQLGFPTVDGGRDYPLESGVGLAADLAFDPTNLIGMGAGVKAAKTLGKEGLALRALQRFMK